METARLPARPYGLAFGVTYGLLIFGCEVRPARDGHPTPERDGHPAPWFSTEAPRNPPPRDPPRADRVSSAPSGSTAPFEHPAPPVSAGSGPPPAVPASRPVVLSDLAINPTKGASSNSGQLELSARATLVQPMEPSTYIHVKSWCPQAKRLITDVGYLHAHYSKPLERHAVGESAEVRGVLFSQGLPKPPVRCQFEFRVGGRTTGPAIVVAHACWNGTSVTDAPCTPKLHPSPPSNAKLPLKVHRLRVQRRNNNEPTHGLHLTYLVRINTPQTHNVRLTLKSTCRIGDRALTDLEQANLTAGPFTYEPGETLARAAHLYWGSAFEMDQVPDDCDISASLWTTTAGTLGAYQERRIKNTCLTHGRLRRGPCRPRLPSPRPPAPLDRQSLEIDAVKLELVAPHGIAANEWRLNIQADVTVAKRVGQNDGLTAQARCSRGPATNSESAYLFGPELHYLQPGETGRMTAHAFGTHPLPYRPKVCVVEFFGGPRFSSSDSDDVSLGRFCLKKAKVKKGAAC